MERDADKGGRGVAVALAVVLVMLPVLYVLSIGPAWWLFGHVAIAVDGLVAIGVSWFYAPLRRARDHCLADKSAHVSQANSFPTFPLSLPMAHRTAGVLGTTSDSVPELA